MFGGRSCLHLQWITAPYMWVYFEEMKRKWKKKNNQRKRKEDSLLLRKTGVHFQSSNVFRNGYPLVSSLQPLVWILNELKGFISQRCFHLSRDSSDKGQRLIKRCRAFNSPRCLFRHSVATARKLNKTTYLPLVRFPCLYIHPRVASEYHWTDMIWGSFTLLC